MKHSANFSVVGVYNVMKGKTDMFQKIDEAVKEYKLKKGTTWIPLAKLLSEAQVRGKDLSGVGLSESSLKRFTSAYDFLEIHRPDSLKPPYDLIQASARSVAQLPRIYGKLPQETRDKDIQEYIEKILCGALGGEHAEVTAMRLGGDRQGISLGSSLSDRKISKATIEEDELAIVGKTLDYFDDQIRLFIRKHGYEKLRRLFSIQCEELTIKLNCISDSEYKKQWDSRKETSV